MELRKKKKVDYEKFEDEEAIISVAEMKIRQRFRIKPVRAVIKEVLSIPRVSFSPKGYHLDGDVYLADKLLENELENEDQENGRYSLGLISWFRQISRIDHDQKNGVYSVVFNPFKHPEAFTPYEYVVERFKSYNHAAYKELADHIERVGSIFKKTKQTVKEIVKAAREGGPPLPKGDPKPFPTPQEAIPKDIPAMIQQVVHEIDPQTYSFSTPHRTFHLNDKLATLLGYRPEEFVEYLLLHGMYPVFAPENQMNSFRALHKIAEIWTKNLFSEVTETPFKLILITKNGIRIPTTCWISRIKSSDWMTAYTILKFDVVHTINPCITDEENTTNTNNPDL